jgi:hypothetical protein
MAKKKIAKKKIAKKKIAKKTAKKAKAKKPTVAQRIAEMKKEFESAKNKVAREGKALFKEATKEIFKEFKSLERFAWPQYTPHWNDGDACYFGVDMDSLAINEEIDGESESLYTLEHINDLLSNKEREEARIIMELPTKKSEWEISSLKNDLETLRTRDPEEVNEKYILKKGIISLLENISETVYEDMFGEGLVVVSRDGVKVEGYEHD